MIDFERRFWTKVEKRGTYECWSWTASMNGIGYGVMSRNGKTAYAHRISYELAIGPIPDGLQIDHLCRNRGCVNPRHLEAVSSQENTLRGNGATAVQARKTHCKHGHEFTPENTYRWKKRNGRQCRKCHAITVARRKAALVAARGETREEPMSEMDEWVRRCENYGSREEPKIPDEDFFGPPDPLEEPSDGR